MYLLGTLICYDELGCVVVDKLNPVRLECGASNSVQFTAIWTLHSVQPNEAAVSVRQGWGQCCSATEYGVESPR